METRKTGNLIATIRKEQGRTQQDLANELGVSSAAISKWERGLGFPDASLIESLASSLNISIADLYAGERKEEQGVLDDDFISSQEANWFLFIFTLTIYLLLSLITRKWSVTWGIWGGYVGYRMFCKEKQYHNRMTIIGWGLYSLAIATIPLLSAPSLLGIAPYVLTLCSMVMAGLGIEIMSKSVHYPSVFEVVCGLFFLLSILFKQSRTANFEAMCLNVVWVILAYIVVKAMRNMQIRYLYDSLFALYTIFTSILITLLSYVVFSPLNPLAYWGIFLESTMLYCWGVYWLSNYTQKRNYGMFSLIILYFLAIYIENVGQYRLLIPNVSFVEISVLLLAFLGIHKKESTIYFYVPFYLAVLRVVLTRLDNPSMVYIAVCKYYLVITIPIILLVLIETKIKLRGKA